MRFLRFVVVLGFAITLGRTDADESTSADAIKRESILSAIVNLDDPSFERREAASAQLLKFGATAVPALADAAEMGSLEVSVRAFELLQRIYRSGEDSTYEEIESVFLRLKQSDRLDVASRAERAIQFSSEIRQSRAIAQFERLGGIVNLIDRDQEQRQFAAPSGQYLMVGKDWKGGNEGLRLLTRIEEVRTSKAILYIIRGTNISDETILDLKAELPFLEIQSRGPARLGISNARGASRCEIGSVEAGSAADRAGLQPYDRVIEIDGHPIRSFDELINIVGEKESGDSISVVFLRGQEEHQTTAQLMPWSKPVAAKLPSPRR